ncbi:hypothetical protein N7517_010878 [Penicillium concentricum]|uniref:Cation efflux protein n=1 Tax=Penicillium concentricum TaxID=293559 RepID=A0A9W9RCD1_9EURO|nr:uncharacterized protein N7517_010878 [Penicillium concentricum]KAJ5356269.1 hypothetical protein N7517_010878 [Penicillium concentricum]
MNFTTPVDEKHSQHKHFVNAAKAGSQSPYRDLAMAGVLIHVLGDCANNLGVMAAALVIWLAHYGGRFYADPAASMGISIMIFVSSIPLIKRAGAILLQSAPNGVEHDDVQYDLEHIPGIISVHELHIWRLNQKKSLASAHVILSHDALSNFTTLAKTVNECFHAYGIHSVTLQPEVYPAGKPFSVTADDDTLGVNTEGREATEAKQDLAGSVSEGCQIVCGTLCTDMGCCN